MRNTLLSWNTVLTKLGFSRKRGRNGGRRNHLTRRLGFEPLEDRQMLAPVMVSNNSDIVNGNVTSIAALIANPGPDGISLREAITAANTSTAADEITFDSSLNDGQILLSLANGQLNISRELTIDASSLPAGITINANDPTPGHTGTGIRVFNITDPTGGSAPPLVTLIGLALMGGDVGSQSPQGPEGGAIRSAARLVISDCTILQNEADTGGGVFVQVAGGGAAVREVLRIENNSIIEGNDALLGGGLAVVSGNGSIFTSDTITITGSTISDNHAQSGNGGGVLAELYGADLTIVDSTLALNEAQNGGAIHATLTSTAARVSTVAITDSTLEQNDVTNDGAGIYAFLNAQSVFRVQDSTLSANDAASRGGGIFAGSNGSINAQPLLQVQDSTLGGNEAGNDGGGIFATLSGTSRIEAIDTLVIQNEGRKGAGIYAETTGGTSSIHVEGATFDSNEATDDGGGLYAVAASGSTVEVVGSQFDQNKAGLSGGGVYTAIQSNATATIANSTLSGNGANTGATAHTPRTGRGGGGVFAAVQPDASLSIVDSQLIGNIAINGGGLRLNMPAAAGHQQAQGAVVALERSRVEANRAVSRGGGVYAAVGAGGQVRVEESVITGNDAGITLTTSVDPWRIPDSGGGIYAYLFSDQSPYPGPPVPASLVIAGTEVSSNTAGKHGGGIALCTKRQNASSAISRLSVYNSTISGNTAGHTTAANYPGTGGGVHLAIYAGEDEEALDARFQNVTITNNKADQGAGVWSFVPSLPGVRNDVRLTNSIASANKKHNLQANNLWGSFNIPLTVFNIIGTGNTTWTHDTHQPQPLRNEQPPGSDPASGNIFTDIPMLGDLQWNGGLTGTHAPMTGSPAIDAGSNALLVIPFSSTELTTDQRGVGFARKYNVPGVHDPGEIVDIGAYEIGLAKVIDVRLDNPTGWLRDPYSYAEIVPTGKQLAPIFTSGVNQLQVVFSEEVDQSLLTSTNVKLLRVERHFHPVACRPDGLQSGHAHGDLDAFPAAGCRQVSAGNRQRRDGLGRQFAGRGVGQRRWNQSVRDGFAVAGPVCG